MSTSFISRSRYLLASLVALVLLLPSFSLAQEAVTTAAPVAEPVLVSEDSALVADVNIHNANIVDNLSREVTVGFTIMSSLGLQDNVRYGVELYEVTSDQQVLRDKFVFDEVLTLPQGEYVSREFTYLPPATVEAGDYELRVVSRNQTGVPLAAYSLGTVTFSKSQIDAEVVTESCSFDNITDGEIECVVTNTSNIEKEVTIEVQITAGDLFGQKVGTLFTTNVAVPANSSVSYTLPSYAEDKIGGVYSLNSQIFIQGRQLLDRTIYTERFGTINPKISNLFVLEGEEPVLGVVVVSAPAGTFINIAPTSPSELCALTRTDIKSTRTDVTLSSGCKGSSMTISLMGADGSVFDIKEVYLKGAPDTGMDYPQTKPVGAAFFIIVILIALTMVWLLILLLKNNQKTTMMLGFLIIPFLGFVLPADTVEAATVVTSKSYVCPSSNISCQPDSDYTVTATFNANNTVVSGGTLTVYAEVSASVNDKARFLGKTMTAEATCPNSGCASNDISGLLTSSFFTTDAREEVTSIGSVSLTAPAAGSYVIGFWSILNGVSQPPYASPAFSYAGNSFNVTVSAPPSVILTPRES